jgi:hypothetical protein
MDNMPVSEMLFSMRSIVTMLHGLVLSGGGLLLLVLALFWLHAAGQRRDRVAEERDARILAWLTTGASVALWLSVLTGTYVVFPLYRAPPPDGVASLAAYPRALLMSAPSSRWLHGFGMEIKEHVPWIAAMLATAAAFTAGCHGAALRDDPFLRRMTWLTLGAAIVLVSATALLGVFINKVAPLW